MTKIALALDKNFSRGGLLRSYLHSRKIVWLCSAHQKGARAVIPNEALDTDEILVDHPIEMNNHSEAVDQPQLSLSDHLAGEIAQERTKTLQGANSVAQVVNAIFP